MAVCGLEKDGAPKPKELVRETEGLGDRIFMRQKVFLNEVSLSVCIHGQKSCQELERIQICVISYVIISVKTQTETDRYIYLQ